MDKGLWSWRGVSVFILTLGIGLLLVTFGWFGEPRVTITAEEFRFSPPTIQISPRQTFRLLLRNQGRERHVFHSPALFSKSNLIQGESERGELQQWHTAILEPNQSVEFYLRLLPGIYPYRCWIKGHRGMEGNIVVSPERL